MTGQSTAATGQPHPEWALGGQESSAQMASLYEMALALAGTVDLDETLHTVLQQVRHVLDYDLCFVTLAAVDGQRLRVQAADSAEAAEASRLVGLELSLDRGINAWIYREGQPTLVDDADADPRRLHIQGWTDEIRSAIGVPLIADGQPIGTIYATRRLPHAFTQAQSDFLTIVATQVAVAVQRARLLDQARSRAQEMEKLAHAVQEALRVAADERDKLAHLHRVGTDMQRADTLHAKLQILADGIRTVGWGRVTVSLRDADLNTIEVVCTGFTPEDEEALRANLLPGSEWKKRFTEQFERFQIGRCYYLPWSDPWVRETIRGVKSHRASALADTWDPQDLLYIPLFGREGQIIGIIGLDDPQDGRRPTAEGLQIIELFAQEAALTIENAKLLADLKLLNADLQEMLAAQAQLLYALEETDNCGASRGERADG
jgi:GAF domain-containing protein